MIRRGKNCVYAIFLGVSILTYCTVAFAKGEEKTLKTAAAPATAEFHWSDHSKLSWDDFKGGIGTDEEEVAAATHCGIGFRTTSPATTDDKPGIEVYNLFYANKSWVKPDAKVPEILTHEQGHFDLCEIYTRKLRSRLSKFDLPANPQAFTTDIKSALVAPQMMFEMFNHSGRVVDASYVEKPPTGEAERLAVIVLEVAVV